MEKRSHDGRRGTSEAGPNLPQGWSQERRVQPRHGEGGVGESRGQATGSGIAGLRREDRAAGGRGRGGRRATEDQAGRWRHHPGRRGGRQAHREKLSDPRQGSERRQADAMLLDMKDTHWLNRKYAAESLGELKDPRAVGPLVAALTDEVGDVRQRAYDSLIKLGGVSVTSLIPLLVAEEEELRQAVTEIVRKIGKPAVEPLAVALGEADERLKARILKVLDRMGYKPKPT